MYDDRMMKVVTVKSYTIKGFARDRDLLSKELEIVCDDRKREFFFGHYNGEMGWHMIDAYSGNDSGFQVWFMGVYFEDALKWLKDWVGEF